MDILDRFKKKKAEEEFPELGDLGAKGGALGPAHRTPESLSEDPELPGLPMGPTGAGDSTLKKDIEVLGSKLDALKSQIEALGHRVRLLEEQRETKKSEETQERYGPGAPKEAGWHY